MPTPTLNKAQRKMLAWRADWNLFVREVLHANLDEEQQAIIRSVQHNKMTAVASGTARGKDYVAACAAICFLYLTPRFDKYGKLIANTKVALTAPTDRQVRNIMVPEMRRQFKSAGVLPGRLVGYDIRTDYDEWFLTGFKASDDNTEAWSGFHASNTMFVVTEASGMSETVFNAIEGNLQGNSRLLIVFNPNITTGYAARAMVSTRFAKFRLNSLHAANVVSKKNLIQGQVDYEWVKDKVETWCTPIPARGKDEGEGDFEFEGNYYRPNDLFRVKVLGLFPRTTEDTLIPYEWVELAIRRYEERQAHPISHNAMLHGNLRIGVDVAGMGRDSSVWCYRLDNHVLRIDEHQSAGQADHMQVAGITAQALKQGAQYHSCYALIDTIGEGAGVYSRLRELGYNNAVSCKYSNSAAKYHDATGQYSFGNMRAYLYWCIRDWLNPRNGNEPTLPPNDRLTEELTSTKWFFASSGAIMIEPKEEVKKRLKRSPDLMDSLANTFYPRLPNSDAIYALIGDAL